MKIGKIEITKIDEGYFLTYDDEGMVFSEERFEALLKELLYKYF